MAVGGETYEMVWEEFLVSEGESLNCAAGLQARS